MKFIYKIGLLLLLSIGLGGSFMLVTAQQNGPEKINISNQDRSITVYPVPVKSTAHIRLSAGLRQEVDKLEIINLIGRKITEQTLIDKSTTDISFSNLDDYPQGIYMVIARDKFGKIVQSAKLIINK
jgi:hypothetical protein